MPLWKSLFLDIGRRFHLLLTNRMQQRWRRMHDYMHVSVIQSVVSIILDSFSCLSGFEEASCLESCNHKDRMVPADLLLGKHLLPYTTFHLRTHSWGRNWELSSVRHKAENPAELCLNPCPRKLWDKKRVAVHYRVCGNLLYSNRKRIQQNFICLCSNYLCLHIFCVSL